MAQSNFLAAARAMDDFAIKQRIQAAVLYHAKTLLSGTGNETNYAIKAMLTPQELDPTMMALVLVDEQIAAQVVVGESGSSVDTSGVEDNLILSRVQAAWPLVASKYHTNPLG